MKIGLVSLGLLIGIVSVSVSLSADDEKANFDAQVNSIVVHLNREAQVDVEGYMRIAELIQRQYGTSADQIKWAVDHSVSWGETVVFAYIQSTTGRPFERMSREDARHDFLAYVETAGMSSDKMAHSLESFLKTAEKERNSRIFERLRVSRRIQALPDLGSGFGLFQDALDFRQLNPPQPTKINVVVSGLAKE
jgi:hypothetical protein